MAGPLLDSDSRFRTVRVELPTIQNWSCHNCSGCCRQHAIEVTDEERRRIERQGWSEETGVPAGRPLFVRSGGSLWKPRYRLAHQPDGACIFLDERGLCRIHARFGEEAKPLACRIYPYAFHPAGGKFAIGLRFSCPSVVANRGRPVSSQAQELRALAEAATPEGAASWPPPEIVHGQRLDWDDVLCFARRLDETLQPADVPASVKLRRALFAIDLAGQSRFDQLRGGRLGEFLDLIAEAAAAENPADADSPPLSPPTRLGRVQFRLLAAHYSRRDSVADRNAGVRGRWTLLRAAVRFARGRGTTLPLRDVFRPVPFAALERPFGGLPDEAEEILTRYFRVKIQGLHFCGPAYYGVSVVEGFRSLALIFPAICYLARWLAAGEERETLSTDDIARAVAIADHHHGYSPALGSWNFRRRVRTLAAAGDIARLCAWYAR